MGIPVVRDEGGGAVGGEGLVLGVGWDWDCGMRWDFILFGLSVPTGLERWIISVVYEEKGKGKGK